MNEVTMQQTLAEIAREFDTDKTQSPGYVENYERRFGHLRGVPVRMLELGVYHGGSLLMWQKYFPHGLIVGLDMEPNPLETMPDRVRFYQGSQNDGALLNRIAGQCAPEGFDIVIDDAAHVGTIARESFRVLFEMHLKPGGIYVIEDWGTGYWQSWSDGSAYHMAGDEGAARPGGLPSFFTRLGRRLGLTGLSPCRSAIDPNFAAHNFGMVGLVKELVDEAAWADITHSERGNKDLPRRVSMIREMALSHGQVMIVKA